MDRTVTSKLESRKQIGISRCFAPGTELGRSAAYGLLESIQHLSWGSELLLEPTGVVNELAARFVSGWV